MKKNQLERIIGITFTNELKKYNAKNEINQFIKRKIIDDNT